MTDVNSINNVTALAGSTAPNSSTRNANSMIGKDDFLKLLVGQLQHQDPLQPSDDTQFIGQMTQFSQLEQESNTAQSTSQIAAQLGRTGALGLIGRTVSYHDADGATQTGVVEQVDIGKDGQASLTIGGNDGIAAGSVTQVK